MLADGRDVRRVNRLGFVGGLVVRGMGVMSITHNRYSREFKDRAVRMFRESRPDCPSGTATYIRIAELLGIGTPETVRHWVQQAQIDAGERPGVTSEESAKVTRLKRENLELRRANAILKAAFFVAELDRPGLS